MTVSVAGQAYVFFCAILGGAAIALVYDFFRIFRRTVKAGNLSTYVQDVLYWLIAALIMFLTFYYSNDGELRAYLFIGALIGVILYAVLLSKIVVDSSIIIIKGIIWFIKALIFIFSYPIRLLWKVSAEPVRRLLHATGKLMLNAKSGGRAKLSKLRFAVRCFLKNKRKKT